MDEQEEPTTVKIGSEEIDIWPGYCTRKHGGAKPGNCGQCLLEGKIQCSPAARAAMNLPQEEEVAMARKVKKRGAEQ